MQCLIFIKIYVRKGLIFGYRILIRCFAVLDIQKHKNEMGNEENISINK